MLRFGMVPALVDWVLKVPCLLRREQRYEDSIYYANHSTLVRGI